MPDEDILHGIVKGMPQMELARDVGRRDHDGERLFFGVDNALEIPAVQPHLINILFNFFRGSYTFGNSFITVNLPSAVALFCTYFLRFAENQKSRPKVLL